MDDIPTVTADASTASSFTLPSIFDFPPFFTRQPNETTWASQRAIWVTLILDFFRYKRLWRLTLSPDTIDNLGIFTNTILKRKLKLDTLRETVTYMVSQGTAAWLPATGGKNALPTVALIYWRTPDEWADSIAEWIETMGQKNSILTSYEISQGDLTTNEVFHGLDSVVLAKALQVLVKRGVATVFKSDDGQETGIKYFGKPAS